MRIIYKRKAVSPLISVVLLIAITFVIASLVSSWMKSSAKEQTEKAINNNNLDCNYLHMALYNAEFNKSGQDELRFELRNTGNIDFTIHRISVIDNESNRQVFNQSYYIYAGDMELITLELNMSLLNNIYDVRIIPEECPSKAAEIEGNEITIYS